MTEKKIYTDTRLTVDTIAQLLNMKRHNVSTAINRCTKKTFNTYLNEYRVKEAINIISKKEAKDLTIDNIAFSSGFTDRTNFYRVFKKFTGLSPTDFKKNINSG
jgi:AraC-like DNA-binding protein